MVRDILDILIKIFIIPWYRLVKYVLDDID